MVPSMIFNMIKQQQVLYVSNVQKSTLIKTFIIWPRVIHKLGKSLRFHLSMLMVPHYARSYQLGIVEAEDFKLLDTSIDQQTITRIITTPETPWQKMLATQKEASTNPMVVHVLRPGTSFDVVL